jgi:hypothetical protein
MSGYLAPAPRPRDFDDKALAAPGEVTTIAETRMPTSMLQRVAADQPSKRFPHGRRTRARQSALALAALLTAACSYTGQLLVPPTPTATNVPPSATQTASPSPTDTPTPSPTPTPTETPTPLPTLTPDHPVAARVLILSLDGLRPDAISPETAPNLSALAARGAVSWSARTISPSVTLPAHASMLTGYDVDTHGLSWNSYEPENGYARSPTLFGMAKATGLRTVMIISTAWLVHIAVPGTVDVLTTIQDGDAVAADKSIAQMYFGFGVMFVHMLGIDHAGHAHGWMSTEYIKAVGVVDRQVAVVLDALAAQGLADSTLVIVTADHGGHGKSHGSACDEDMTIPWIVAGPGVAAGRTLTSSVRIYDTTATALWVLGIPIPEDMDGRPVREAFAQFSS